jgi:hypothetical protein
VPIVDKTRSFHDQIEVKQKDLQPWTIKVNQKQAAIDLAKSERETLARKFEVVREAKEEAENTKTRLKSEKEAKVRVTTSFGVACMLTRMAIGCGTARSTPTESRDGRGT